MGFLRGKCKSVHLIEPIRCLNLYKPGSGLKSIKEMFEQKPPEEPATWKTHTMFGQKRENLFHYTDRNAGRGYSNYRQSPYINRPYIFPVSRRPMRNIAILGFITILLMLVDEDWVDEIVDNYMEKKLGYTFTSLIPEDRTPKAVKEREKQQIAEYRKTMEERFK